MTQRNPDDWFDWRGCSAVQFEPGKLGGRGNVAGTRMFADGVLENYDDGMSAEEIAESYQLDIEPVRDIIAFASAKRTQLACEMPASSFIDLKAWKDEFDWRGCAFVEYDPEKLGGRAAVRNSRVFADGILVNFDSGMSLEELEENFELDRGSIEGVLAFAAKRQMKATA